MMLFILLIDFNICVTFLLLKMYHITFSKLFLSYSFLLLKLYYFLLELPIIFYRLSIILNASILVLFLWFM